MNFKHIFFITIIAVLFFSFVASLSIIFQKPGYRIFLPATNMFNKTGSIKKANIYMMHIGGIIHFSERISPFGSRSGNAEYYLRRLRLIENLKNIKVLILNINSPGGTIAATQAIYNELLKLRKKGVLVISVIQDVGASGAYYIASASDAIFAEPGSLVGSVGVILESMNIKGLLEKIGVGYTVIKSGKYKDILSPYRSMTPDESKMLNALVKSAFSNFYTAVKTNRHLTDKQMKGIADAQIFTGSMAIKNQLIDKIGGRDAAVNFARKKAKILNPSIYEDNGGAFRELRQLFSSKISPYIELFSSLNNLPIAYIYSF